MIPDSVSHEYSVYDVAGIFHTTLPGMMKESYSAAVKHPAIELHHQC
jgi:hypothetical protein